MVTQLPMIFNMGVLTLYFSKPNHCVNVENSKYCIFIYQLKYENLHEHDHETRIEWECKKLLDSICSSYPSYSFLSLLQASPIKFKVQEVNQFVLVLGGHSEGAGYHNFLHFLSIKEQWILSILKTAAWQVAKLSKDSDGNFSFLVVNFFLFTFEKKTQMCFLFFFKSEQKKFGS